MASYLTEKIAVVATIDPDAYTTGAQTSDRVDMSKFQEVAFIVEVGALGSSATIDFKVQECTAATAGTATDLAGKAITQLTQAGTDSDKQAIVNVRAEELSAGYRWLQGILTVGVATSDCGMIAIAGEPVYGPASDNDLASVDEIVTA